MPGGKPVVVNTISKPSKKPGAKSAPAAAAVKGATTKPIVVKTVSGKVSPAGKASGLPAHAKLSKGKAAAQAPATPPAVNGVQGGPTSKAPKPAPAKPAAAKPTGTKPVEVNKPVEKPAKDKDQHKDKKGSEIKPAEPSSVDNKRADKPAEKRSVETKPAAAETPAIKPGKEPKPAAVPAAEAMPVVPGPSLEDASKKPQRKGITIVGNKPAKKPKPKAPSVVMPASIGRLLAPGAALPKPLIASGPNAPRPGEFLTGPVQPPKKPLFSKRELERFQSILLRKRGELAGDVTMIETEALMGSSGSLSHLPQHMAEQGSDASAQSVSLDLAAQDRKLIKEIDDALARIEAGTFGLCELTGKPIRLERLEELPWARHSIEAARELERRARMP